MATAGPFPAVHCGNGMCEMTYHPYGETCNNCPADCGPCTGQVDYVRTDSVFYAPMSCESHVLWFLCGSLVSLLMQFSQCRDPNTAAVLFLDGPNSATASVLDAVDSIGSPVSFFPIGNLVRFECVAPPPLPRPP